MVRLRLMSISLMFLIVLAMAIQQAAGTGGVAWEFDVDGNRQGWGRTHSISALMVSGGTLQCRVVGEDPWFSSPSFSVDAADNPIVLIRMKVDAPGGCQIYWDTQAESTMDEQKVRVFQTGAAGEWELYALNMSGHPKWVGVIREIRIDPPDWAGKVEVDFVRICSAADIPTELSIESFVATDQVVLTPGQPFNITSRITNKGGQPATNIMATLSTPSGFVLLNTHAVQTIPTLAGGDSLDLSWLLSSTGEAAGVISLSVRADTLAPLSSLSRAYVLRPFPDDDWSPTAGAESHTLEGGLMLANSHFRATFLNSTLGFGAVAFDVRDGDTWRRVALLPTFSSVSVDHGSTANRFMVYLPDVSLESTPGGGVTAVFEGTVKDASGHSWLCVFTFSMTPDSDVMGIDYSITPSTAEALRLFEGPMIYVGAGSFGGDHGQCILPGLEWLTWNETSSSTLDIVTKGHVRYVPDARKLTVPWMAVTNGNTAIGLMWDTDSPWYGDENMRSPVYAVPDQFEGKDASLMGIAVPYTPDYIRENQREATTPYPVNAGKPITLTAQVVLACPADSPLVVQDRWYARYGAADILPYPRGGLINELEFSMEAFTDSLWIPAEQQWNVVLEFSPPNRGRPPEFLQALELAARYSDDPNLAATYRTRFAEAVEAGGDTTNFDLPFYVGYPDNAMLNLRWEVTKIIEQQRDDGSWRFDADAPIGIAPNMPNSFLGPDEAAELGISASKAMTLAQYARITGDPVATEHTILALDFMEQFEVPRAAQVWEVPVHTPDVLAAAYAVRAFLEGYEITGRTDYLEKAVYWGRASLPFIYAWQRPDYPWMLYGSVPVFGATMYEGGWFGHIVQWNGLDLAYSLLRLASYDGSYDWETIGTGLLVSGMYQQEVTPAWRGTYRDVFSTFTGERGGPLINPSVFVQCILTKLGADPAAETLVAELEGSPIRITTAALASVNPANAGEIDFTMNYLNNETTYTLMTGLTKPTSLTVDGVLIPEEQDLRSATAGWRYNHFFGTLVVKVTHGASPTRIVVSGAHPRTIEYIAEKRTEIDFQFNINAYFEGWVPVNEINDVRVEGGCLAGTSVMGDPYLVREAMWIAPNTVNVVVVRMRTTGGSSAQLFWVNSEQPDFSESMSKFFPITSDGEYHTYIINVGTHETWKGKTITAIRIDPTQEKGVDFEIDNIIGKLAPDPAYAQFTELVVDPTHVEVNKPVTVYVNMKNTGDLAGDCTAELRLNGTTHESKKVWLEAGAQTEVSFTVTKATAGTYSLAVGPLSGTFVVLAPPKPAAIGVKLLLLSKSSVKPGEEVTVNVTLENSGELPGTYLLVFNLDGVEKDASTVALEGGQSVTRTMKLSSSVEGVHTVRVGDEAVVFEVEKTQTGIGGYLYVLVFVGLTLIVLILLIRARSQT